MTTDTHLLRTILQEGTARTQSEIQQALQAQGMTCSQPKISRLLHQIGAVKVIDSEGKTQYRLPHETGLIHELSSAQEKELIRHCVLNIDANETSIVIHTTPGSAGMVARMIDLNRLHLDVLGTIAGDDTIFVLPKSINFIQKTKQSIETLIKL